jgi:hypothetical protein
MLALREEVARRCDDANLGKIPTAGAAAKSLSARQDNDSAPLLALADGALSARFRSWRGASGKRYVFSVYDRRSCPAYSSAVIVIASARPDGGRDIVSILDTGCFPDVVLAKAAAKFDDGLEFHVHLLAASSQERQAMIADISHLRRN